MSEITADIVETMRQPVLVLDRSCRVVLANRAFRALFEVAASETVGIPLPDLGDGQWNIPELLGQLDRVADDRAEIRDFRIEHDFPDLGRRVMLLNARFMEVPGEGDRILVAIEDVTEREHSARALHESEARLSAMLNQAPIGIGVFDRDGRWIYKNPHLAPVVGDYLPSRDPDPERRWHGFDANGKPLPPSEWPGARALNGETVWPGVDFWTDALGQERWFRVAAAPILKNDEIEEAIIILEDVTERRATADRLRESEARLSAAMNAGRLGVFDYDPRTGRIEWDSPVRAVWGVAEDEEITYETFIAGVHDEDVPWVENAVAKAFDPGGDHLYEAEYRVVNRQSGEVRWVRADGSATFSDDTPVRLVGTVADITERKRAEQESELLTRELSHRVKNTLAVVQSLARMTNGRLGTVESYREAFLGRLQALARAHSLLLDENWERTDLRELIELTVRAFEIDSPEMTILEGDSVDVTAKQAMGLSLVLHELGTNAVKYGSLSEHGGKLRIAWAVEEGEHGPSVHLIWAEREGPPVSPPESHGFGTEMIRETCSYELDGEARLDFAREGLTCEIVFPLE